MTSCSRFTAGCVVLKHPQSCSDNNVRGRRRRRSTSTPQRPRHLPLSKLPWRELQYYPSRYPLLTLDRVTCTRRGAPSTTHPHPARSLRSSNETCDDDDNNTTTREEEDAAGKRGRDGDDDDDDDDGLDDHDD
eukprot:3401048-Rhodomonas_salina.2